MKVFLSSTAQDLVAYRKVADDTILRMSLEAVVMGPRAFPGEPVAECERKARECDVTVRALEVRRRIEHPGASETERWLARTV